MSAAVISKIEVLGYHNITKKEIELTNYYFSLCRVIPLTDKVVEQSIELRQQKSMRIGDAIIAATALSEHLPLLTANVKDFKHIKTLDLIGLEEVKEGLR